MCMNGSQQDDDCTCCTVCGWDGDCAACHAENENEDEVEHEDKELNFDDEGV